MSTLKIRARSFFHLAFAEIQSSIGAKFDMPHAMMPRLHGLKKDGLARRVNAGGRA
jgi:hypothetical protein